MTGTLHGFDTQEPAIRELRRKIRYATEADNPQLLSLWLSMEETLAPACATSRWRLYAAEFRLLLDTLADDLIPNHWRTLCMDQIYRPLAALSRIADGEPRRRQLNELLYELRTTSHFFQASLTG
ncbi:hypothetical protein O5O45_25270 [Hahella aquimaris]|uniref:hypothetical protein n=1 Tax=Hahella sp. HNIBRBA332 TaxID=3015983 RepID=UPI00273CA431|nr:hypothetical protein [Hahella sp. HNIBRBA332]WLQ13044.1 hypothetical protein O5O45_25270 [Hahella sp. HNIBRBA332]